MEKFLRVIISFLQEQIVPEQNIDDVYRRIEKLGEGSYAMVYKCENKSAFFNGLNLENCG